MWAGTFGCAPRIGRKRGAVAGKAASRSEVDWWRQCLATLFYLIALVIGVALHDLSFGYIASINLILGSFTGLPLVYVGKAKVKRAAVLLSKYQGESHTHSALNKAQQSRRSLTTGLNPDLSQLPSRDSVTEHTTLDLRSGDSARRMPMDMS